MTHSNADPFETLGDPQRRRIVDALRDGERAVNDIVEQMEIHQSGVSRHLRILQDAGFVQVRPEGQRRLYSLRPERFQEIDEWLSAYRELWESRLDRLARELEKKKHTRSNEKSHAEKPHADRKDKP